VQVVVAIDEEEQVALEVAMQLELHVTSLVSHHVHPVEPVQVAHDNWVGHRISGLWQSDSRVAQTPDGAASVATQVREGCV
jgi:hypothetical protein